MKFNIIFVISAIIVSMGLLSTLTMSLIQSADAAVQRGDNGFCHNNDINNEGEFTPKENSNGGCHSTGHGETSSGHAEQESGFGCATSAGVTDDTHLVNTPSGNENFNCHVKG